MRHYTYEPTTRALMIGIATPKRNAIFSPDEPRNATKNDNHKSSLSMATPIVAVIYSLRDCTEHDVTPWEVDCHMSQ